MFSEQYADTQSDVDPISFGDPKFDSVDVTKLNWNCDGNSDAELNADTDAVTVRYAKSVAELVIFQFTNRHR